MLDRSIQDTVMINIPPHQMNEMLTASGVTGQMLVRALDMIDELDHRVRDLEGKLHHEPNLTLKYTLEEDE